MPPAAIKIGLPPIVEPAARLLILGTLPGDESLRKQEYYGHPQNHFWRVIADVVGEAQPDGYAARIAMLTRHRLALWDVLASAERAGSLDAAIRHAKANDILELLAQLPSIRTIAFNGQGAEKLFMRHVARPSGGAPEGIALLRLPSTSPAYTKRLADKSAQWRDGLRAALAE
ncbi:MAG: DNA-deoxyinosine glycosylase [Hyphomicrobium sp.]